MPIFSSWLVIRLARWYGCGGMWEFGRTAPRLQYLHVWMRHLMAAHHEGPFVSRPIESSPSPRLYSGALVGNLIICVLHIVEEGREEQVENLSECIDSSPHQKRLPAPYLYILCRKLYRSGFLITDIFTTYAKNSYINNSPSLKSQNFGKNSSIRCN